MLGLGTYKLLPAGHHDSREREPLKGVSLYGQKQPRNTAAA